MEPTILIISQHCRRICYIFLNLYNEFTNTPAPWYNNLVAYNVSSISLHYIIEQKLHQRNALLYPQNNLKKVSTLYTYILWEDFRLGPQLGIVHFGMGKDRSTSHPHEFA